MRLQMLASLTILHQIAPQVRSLATVEEFSTSWPSFAKSDDLLSRLKRYGYTKILNEYFKGELRRRLDASGCDIVVMSTDAGMLKTDGSIATYPTTFKVVASVMGSATATGATSALFRATAEQVGKDKERYKGSYLSPKAFLKPTNDESRDERLGKEIWMTTEAVVGKALAAE